MPHLRRLLLAATLTLVASLAVASSASAEPGKGADVVRQDECFTYEDGTLCIDARYVQNETFTPSGNFSYHAHGETAYKFTGEGYLEGCNGSSSGKFNYHYLVKDGELHESGSRNKGEFSIDCFGYSEQCTFAYHAHYANGELQFSRPDFNCSDPVGSEG